jgi:hypothetical protein
MAGSQNRTSGVPLAKAPTATTASATVTTLVTSLPSATFSPRRLLFPILPCLPSKPAWLF